MDMFMATLRIQMCCSRYVLAKRAHLAKVKIQIDKRYLELAEENQALRSESSRANDPVLPDDIGDA